MNLKAAGQKPKMIYGSRVLHLFNILKISMTRTVVCFSKVKPSITDVLIELSW